MIEGGVDIWGPWHPQPCQLGKAEAPLAVSRYMLILEFDGRKYGSRESHSHLEWQLSEYYSS